MIETAINAIITPILAALTPAVPFYWGIVERTVKEYVSLSGVYSSVNQDYDGSDNKQFNIVTYTSAARAGEIEQAIRSGLQNYRGVSSGYGISRVAHVRSVEFFGVNEGEYRIAAEYHVNYVGGVA